MKQQQYIKPLSVVIQSSGSQILGDSTTPTIISPKKWVYDNDDGTQKEAMDIGTDSKLADPTAGQGGSTTRSKQWDVLDDEW